MELHPHRHQYRIIIVTLFTALALISLALVLRYQQSGLVREPGAVQSRLPSYSLTSIPIKKQTTVVKQDTSTHALFSIVPTKVGVLTYKVGKQVSVQVVGSTDGKEVIGYDVLMTGGKNAYDVVSVKSLIPEFTILKFLKDNHLTITGILKPSAKEQKSFEGTPIVEVVIVPKQTGTLNLQILSEQGKESSKAITVGSLGNSKKLLASDSDNLRLDIKQ